jgi:hypothetical protein
MTLRKHCAHLVVFCLLAGVLAACAPSMPTLTAALPPTQPPTLRPVAAATVFPAATAVPAAIAAPAQPTRPPTRTVTPALITVYPSPTPLAQFALEVQPDQLWSLQNVPAQFQARAIDDRLTQYTRTDRNVIFVVDTYVGTAGEAGNTGEGLRNRARAAVAQLYPVGVRETGVLDPGFSRWDTGISFTTANGASGEALYAQPGRGSGDYRVYGFIFAYRTELDKTALPLLQVIRDSFQPVTALPLTVPAGAQPLWLLYSNGYQAFNEQLPRAYFLAIYTRLAGQWRELTHVMLEGPDTLLVGACEQVALEPGHVWVQVSAFMGAHSGYYALYMLDGQNLVRQVQHGASDPGAGSLADLDGDGHLEVILNTSDDYVFCYACGVRYYDYQVLRWDGAQLVALDLAPLPASAPAELCGLANRAVALAHGGFWQEAQQSITRALAIDGKDPTVVRDAALIRLRADPFGAQARDTAYPLLGKLFYGDYAGALDIMRPYTPQALFAKDCPLIQGTVAEGGEDLLAQWITTVTSAALELKPDLAGAYLLRGWAAYRGNPADRSAVADIQRAAQLAPGDALIAGCAAYLSK